MQNNFIEKIAPSVRIIILILLMVSLLLAKSIYLILFITSLTLILFIITDKKVNIYVKFLKKTFLLLLFFFIVYIIIFRQNTVSMIIFAYKLIIVDVLIKIFLLNIEFRSLHEGIYGCLLPLKKSKIDIEVFSLDVALSIYYIKFLLESTDKIKVAQQTNGKKIINVKNYLIPSFIYSINELEQLQDNLKIKFYKLNYKKANFISKFILILFILLFIVCVYKEVIL